MERITIKHLHVDAALLNHATGANLQPWEQDAQGQWRANVGTFIIDRAYGGFRLERIATEGGGVYDVSPRGSAREVHNFIRAMLAGLDLAQERAA